MDPEKAAFMSRAKTGSPWDSGTVLQVLTLSSGARLITWRMTCLSLGKFRWGSMHFWNRRACIGYASVPGSYNKKAFCHTRAYVGHSTNTCILRVQSPGGYHTVRSTNHPVCPQLLLPTLVNSVKSITIFFPAFAHFFKPKTFRSKLEVETALKYFLASKPWEFYHTCINRLIYQWRKCIDVQE